MMKKVSIFAFIGLVLAAPLVAEPLVEERVRLSSGKTAAAAEEGDGWELTADDLDFTNLPSITKSRDIDTNPVWSPDGQHIAFASDRDGD